MMGVPEATGNALSIVRRGIRLSPAFTVGLLPTLALAVLTMAGRVSLPIAVQQIIDRGFGERGAAGPGELTVAAGLSLAGVVVTAVCSYLMKIRVCRAGENGLAETRVKAFRHVLRMPVLDQQGELRGALVSRVTSDVDAISTFVQVFGVNHVVSLFQVLLATAVMAVYSWQLTLIVWACFLPLFILLRVLQPQIARRFSEARQRIGLMLGIVGESVTGAVTIRAYDYEKAMAERVGDAIDRTRAARMRAHRLSTGVLSIGEVVPGLANAAVVLAGVKLGVAGELTAGQLIAILFLVAFFVAPIQVGIELLNETQNAVACWRRVLGLIEYSTGIIDPGSRGVDTPRKPPEIRFDNVDFRYPVGEPVLRKVNVTIAAGSTVAVVGQTGSGKSTFAKLLVRLMEPTLGEVRLDEVPLPRIRLRTLRRRVVMVPQDGYLFDTTIADNVRYGRPNATDADVEAVFAELGLGDWLEGLPRGVATEVGQRGQALSMGERQLVALARAHIADADLLVLDEATSAVDPATDVRIQSALEAVTRGRTAVIVAHRMSAAESADEVLVFNAGQVVERGHHSVLATRGEAYASLYKAWIAGDSNAARTAS